MSNLVIVISTIFIVAQFEGIKCNPLNVEKEIGGVSRNVRVFKPDKKEWVHFHHSWGLPHFPSLTSVSNLFQDEDDKEQIVTKKRLEALEKNQKEILAILQKLNDEIIAKNDQPKPQSLVDKTPTSQPSIEKEITTKKIEEYVSSTISTSVPSTVSTSVPSTVSKSVPITVSPSVPSTVSTSIPSTVSTSISSTTSSSVSSTTSSTPVTRAPVIETSTVQDITQQPQSSPSSVEPQPQIPDQNENANSNSNSNTGENQAAADSAGLQTTPTLDTNSGSIVAFTSDENERGAIETTESTP